MPGSGGLASCEKAKKNIPWGGGSNEELRSIGVLSCVGHAQKTLLAVLQLEVLILELGSVDYQSSASTLPSFLPVKDKRTRFSSGAITLCEISSLDHEVLDDSVECRALVSKILLSRGQSTEVLYSLGNRLSIETHHNATEGFITMGDVEVDFVCDFGAFGGFCGLGEERKLANELALYSDDMNKRGGGLRVPQESLERQRTHDRP
jgi:hypothetical protein